MGQSGRYRVQRLRPMRLRLHDPTLLDELSDFLRRTECRVRALGPATLEVEIPDAGGGEQQRRELELYLATWRAMHEDAEVEIDA